MQKHDFLSQVGKVAQEVTSDSVEMSKFLTKPARTLAERYVKKVALSSMHLQGLPQQSIYGEGRASRAQEFYEAMNNTSDYVLDAQERFAFFPGEGDFGLNDSEKKYLADLGENQFYNEEVGCIFLQELHKALPKEKRAETIARGEIRYCEACFNINKGEEKTFKDGDRLGEKSVPDGADLKKVHSYIRKIARATIPDMIKRDATCLGARFVLHLNSMMGDLSGIRLQKNMRLFCCELFPFSYATDNDDKPFVLKDFCDELCKVNLTGLQARKIESFNSLQKEYEETTNNTKLSAVEKIKSFVEISNSVIKAQLVSDNNHRTARALLRAMMISNGIVPPLFDIVNNKIGIKTTRIKIVDIETFDAEQLTEFLHSQMKVLDSEIEKAKPSVIGLRKKGASPNASKSAKQQSDGNGGISF